jgi:Na+/melibiose symporter-like transporter
MARRLLTRTSLPNLRSNVRRRKMKTGKALRLTALILCVVMLMTMLTACAKKEEPVKEDENTEETEEKPNDFKTIYE